MPTSPKFDETDRWVVLNELRRRTGVEFSTVGRRRKWLQDSVGRNYCVIGGYGQWHGIPEEVMEAEISASVDGMLAIVLRRRFGMAIFIGSLRPLIEGRERLYRASKTTGDYQFTYTRRGSRLIIDQVPQATLYEIGKFEFGVREKESVERLRSVERLIKKLSVEERKEFLKNLQDKV